MSSFLVLSHGVWAGTLEKRFYRLPVDDMDTRRIDYMETRQYWLMDYGQNTRRID